MFRFSINNSWRYGIKGWFWICLLLMGLTKPGMCRVERYTIGPMFHINFSKDEITYSIALEGAAWWDDAFPISVDAGLEWEPSKIRVYSEIQSGVYVVGLSCGPVLELDYVNLKPSIGIQVTIWANYYAGLDLRYRAMPGGGVITSSGFYAKILLDDKFKTANADF
jgi:hypothetical protein